MNHEEKTIIRQAQRGNILAFERLVKTYDKRVLQMAYSMLNNTEDAEDVYQEIFVRIYKNLQRFQFKSEFSTWLYRVVVNTCINYQRMRSRRRRFSMNNEHASGSENWQMNLKGKEQNPEESALNKELSQEIDSAIDQLSAKQKTVFILRHYHGKKLKEIAAIMHCTEGTVKNYLFRATQKMQRQLYQYASI